MLKRPSIVAATLVIAACGRATDVTSPPAARRDRLTLTSESNYENSCARAGDVIPGPTVLVNNATGEPQANVPVTFTVSSGGKIAHSTVSTDAYGLANSGEWTLATAVGANTVVARLPDGTAAAFDLLSRATPPGTVITSFNLVAMNGRALPGKDAYGDAVTGGRLYLADDGTYALWYVIDGWDFTGPTELGWSLCSDSIYSVGSSSLDLYGNDSRHLATATVRGDSLVMTYDNSSSETYRFSAGSLPAVR